jgi:hypothetical protein
MDAEEKSEELELFSIYAELKGYENPLILCHIPFGRLMEDIIIPYDSGDSFFIDGVNCCQKDSMQKIKIIKQGKLFDDFFHDLHWKMRQGNKDIQELYANQYQTRLEAIFRETSDDVTSQVLQAYNKTIKPSIGDYLTKRKDLIEVAFRVFNEGIRLLGTS